MVHVYGVPVSPCLPRLIKLKTVWAPPPLSVKVPALSAIYSYSYDYSTLDYGGRVVQIDKQAVKDPMGIIW